MIYGNVINEAGEALDYTYHSGAENNHYVLVIGHGLNENKDTQLIAELSHKVSEEGMSVLRFSFSGNGNSQGQHGDYTISKGIKDLRTIVSAICAVIVSWVCSLLPKISTILASLLIPTTLLFGI